MTKHASIRSLIAFNAAVGALVLQSLIACAAIAEPFPQANQQFVTRKVKAERKMLTVFWKKPSKNILGALLTGGLLGALLTRAPEGEFVLEPEGEAPVKGKHMFGLVFSPDLSRYAFLSGAFVFYFVVDGRSSQQLYRSEDTGGIIFLPVFSPDGKTLSYTARRAVTWSKLKGRQYDLVIGDEKLGPFEAARPPLYSRDGTKMSYAIKDKGKWVLSDNGKELATDFEELFLEGYTPANELIIAGRRNGQWLVEIAGQVFPQKGRPLWVFPHASRPHAFALYSEKDGVRILSDAGEFGPYTGLISANNDWESGGIAFVALRGKDQIVYHVDGVDHGGYPDGRLLAVDWDLPGAPWAYGAKSGGEFRLFTSSGEQGPFEDMVGPFSGPSGFIFGYRSGTKWHVKATERELGPYLEVASKPSFWQFSPDRKHLAFAARDEEGWQVVIDGVKGSSKGSRIVALKWQSPTTLRYIVAKDPGPTKQKAASKEAWYLVEEEIDNAP